MPNGAAKKNDHATGNGENRFEYARIIMNYKFAAICLGPVRVQI